MLQITSAFTLSRQLPPDVAGCRAFSCRRHFTPRLKFAYHYFAAYYAVFAASRSSSQLSPDIYARFASRCRRCFSFAAAATPLSLMLRR